MNEELMIKVKVDTSEVTPSINKIKNQVENVSKTMNATSSSSSATQQASNNAKQAAAATTQNVNKMIESIKRLSSISSFADLAEIGTELLTAHIQTKAVEAAMDKVEDATERVTKDTQKWVEELREAVALSRASGKDTSYTYAKGGKDNSTLVRADDVGTSERLIDRFDDISDTAGDAADAAGAMGKNIGGAAGGAAKLAGVSATIKAVWTAIKGVIAGIAVYVAALIPVFIMLGTVIKGVQAAFKVAPLGDEIYQSASKFGFSTKAYQEWGWVMERNGATIDDLTGFLETLGSEQAAVITGSEEAAQKFKNLGISAEEAAGMGSQELFETTISKLQGIENATERAAYAYELFGDEASRIMNVISMNNAEMQRAINEYNLLGGAMGGELVENSNRLQNSIARMKQAWQGISNTLAEVFIPIVEKVVNWITKAIVAVNLFLRVIFGLDLSPASKGTDKAVASTNKYTGGIKAAKKAAEELKRVTMGFDELNIVSDPNKGSSADTGSTGGAFGGSSMPSMDSGLLNMEDLNLDSMYAWFEKYKGLIAQIVTWSLTLIGIILAVVGCCTMNPALAILGFGMAALGITVGFTSGAFEEAWEGAKKGISAACEAIGKVVGVVAKAIGDFFIGAWELIKAAWKDVVAYFDIIWTGIKGVFSVVGTYLGGMFKTAWEAIKAVWNVVKAYFEAVWAGIKAVFAVVKAVLTGNFSGAWDAIKNVWNKAKAFFQSIWDGIKNVFAATVNWFGNTFSAAWNAITKVFNKVGTFFTGVWNKIKSIFKNVGGSIGKAVSDSFASAINWVLSKAIGIINGFISAINTAIKIINKIPGVEIKKITKLEVPKLATGGIATRSTIANIGEAGAEAILPLENNTGWMDTLADKIAERNSAPSKIVLKVGEKEFAWAAINGINNVTKQTGSLQLAL